MFRGTKRMLLTGLLILITLISFGVYMATEAFNSLVAPPKPVKALRVEQVKQDGYQMEVLGYEVTFDVNPLLEKVQEAQNWFKVNAAITLEQTLTGLKKSTVDQLGLAPAEVEAVKGGFGAKVKEWQAKMLALWTKAKEVTKGKMAAYSQ